MSMNRLEDDIQLYRRLLNGYDDALDVNTMNPHTLRRSISPPPKFQRRQSNSRASKHLESSTSQSQRGASKISGLAAIEAGKAVVSDHLAYFCEQLAKVQRPESSTPRLLLAEYANLYQRNSNDHGHHFVIHQHNHPVAGCHYDLRLQFSASSSCSFAIPYGLPGNPNSRRQGRMAIETRVHTLWNNLIESASHTTGSLLIWDTGEYEILPRRISRKSRSKDDEDSDADANGATVHDSRPENLKLVDAFQSRYIRLRLQGTRLPKGYTITLRLPFSNDVIKYSRPMRQKRKQCRAAAAAKDTDLEDEDTDDIANPEVGLASDDEDENATIRANNAYTGAENTIGSIHQRHWFITLDRANSGFTKNGEKWIRKSSREGFEPFFVCGADVETSVVTGRTSAEVMQDEGVEDFVARKRWKPVLN